MLSKKNMKAVIKLWKNHVYKNRNTKVNGPINKCCINHCVVVIQWKQLSCSLSGPYDSWRWLSKYYTTLMSSNDMKSIHTFTFVQISSVHKIKNQEVKYHDPQITEDLLKFCSRVFKLSIINTQYTCNEKFHIQKMLSLYKIFTSNNKSHAYQIKVSSK